MTVSFEVSSKEMLRISQLSYEGRKIEVFLASDPDDTLTSDSLYTAWKALELPTANGYARYQAEIPVGAYDTNDLRHEIGLNPGANQTFPVAFAGTGVGYSYDNVVVAVHESDGGGGWIAPTYIHSRYKAFPAENVFPNQEIQYPIQVALGR